MALYTIHAYFVHNLHQNHTQIAANKTKKTLVINYKDVIKAGFDPFEFDLVTK